MKIGFFHSILITTFSDVPVSGAVMVKTSCLVRMFDLSIEYTMRVNRFQWMLGGVENRSQTPQNQFIQLFRMHQRKMKEIREE